MRPKVKLTIAELVLRDLPYAQRQRISAAVEQELARLLAVEGVPGAFQNGGSLAAIQVDCLTPGLGANPKMIGTAIARQIYSQLAASVPDAIYEEVAQ